jgi:hypothetical protein
MEMEGKRHVPLETLVDSIRMYGVTARKIGSLGEDYKAHVVFIMIFNFEFILFLITLRVPTVHYLSAAFTVCIQLYIAVLTCVLLDLIFVYLNKAFYAWLFHFYTLKMEELCGRKD